MVPVALGLIFCAIWAFVSLIAWFTNWYYKQYEERVWRNGKTITGYLVKHNYNKGHPSSLEVHYYFNKVSYRYDDHHANEHFDWPDGTRLLLKVDSIHPEDAIIIGIPDVVIESDGSVKQTKP